MSYRCSSRSRCYVDYYRSLRTPHSEVLHHQKNWLLVMIQSFPCRIYVLLLLMKSWKTNLGRVPKRHAGVNFTSITGNRHKYFLPAWIFISGELPVYGTTVTFPPTDKPRFACVSHSGSLNCISLTLLPMAVTP